MGDGDHTAGTSDLGDPGEGNIWSEPDEFGKRHPTPDPGVFELPGGYTPQQNPYPDERPQTPPGRGGFSRLSKWPGLAVGVAVAGGLIVGALFLFGDSKDTAPAERPVASTAGTAAVDVTTADTRGAALDTLPEGTLATLPPDTLATLPPETQATVPSATTTPTTTLAATTTVTTTGGQLSRATGCAQAANEVAEVLRAHFELFDGKTVREAANALAEFNTFDAQVTPILERGRDLGCDEADLQLICDALAGLVPNGEASELVYASLAERCA